MMVVSGTSGNAGVAHGSGVKLLVVIVTALVYLDEMGIPVKFVVRFNIVLLSVKTMWEPVSHV